MTAVYLLPVGLVAVLYGVFLAIGRTSESSSDKLFTESRYDSRWAMLFSLLATNLTVSGGIIASISGAKFYGWWFLAAPLSAAAGLIVFALCHGKLSERLNLDRLFPSDLSSDQLSPVMMAYCGATALIAAFLAGWEIHIASQIISSFYTEFPIVRSNVFVISLVIAVLAGIYVSRGGWDRSVITDIIQAFGVGVFLILLALVVKGASGASPPSGDTAHLSTAVLVTFVVALFVNNVGFSLVNPSNWQIAQSTQKRTEPVFWTGAVLLTLFTLIVFVLAGRIEGANPFSVFAAQNVPTAVMVAMVPLFVWSTIDTSSVAISHLAEQIVVKYLDNADNHKELTVSMRRYYPLTFLVVAVLISQVLNTFNPNIFLSLLAGTSALIVFVPVLVGPLFTKESHYLKSRRCGVYLFLCFIAVIAVSCAMTFKGWGEYIFLLALVGLGASWWIAVAFNKPMEAEGSGGHADESV